MSKKWGRLQCAAHRSLLPGEGGTNCNIHILPAEPIAFHGIIPPLQLDLSHTRELAADCSLVAWSAPLCRPTTVALNQAAGFKTQFLAPGDVVLL